MLEESQHVCVIEFENPSLRAFNQLSNVISWKLILKYSPKIEV